MNIGRFLALFLMIGALSTCTDELLDLEPVDQLTDEIAISDARGARAALTGAYEALQSSSYYGGSFLFFNDLSADNAVHTGTFHSHAEAARNQLRPENSAVTSIWNAIYEAINRTNHLILQVPDISDLSDSERSRILGEARFLRALHYHNLVRLWGDVPLRTAPIASPAEASSIERAPMEEAYTQILSDLEAAQSSLAAEGDTRRATLGAVHALAARVHLYREEWGQAEAAAEALEDLGYDLAADYASLFPATGGDTPEDIFRVLFTVVQWNQLGWYYIGSSFGGRGEIAPQQSLMDAYAEGDVRRDWTIHGDVEGAAHGTKFPTTAGAEHPHVIRFAEIILTKAEALAQQGNLDEAVAAYNRIRVRAGLTPHVLDTDVTSQEEVLEAIWHERRLELALEGDRFSDLRRTGRAVEVLNIPAFQAIYPIPQAEMDVAPNMTQNPGY
ncbi:MAG: RagB/SusD family nutrient uptake outer membrane protein [Longimicrobiales bacterium]